MAKVKQLTKDEFERKYGEALEALEGDDDMSKPSNPKFGEVKIPGHGWHGCILGADLKPTHFYSDDDGWRDAPKG